MHNYHETENAKIKRESNVRIQSEIKDYFGATICVKRHIMLFFQKRSTLI